MPPHQSSPESHPASQTTAERPARAAGRHHSSARAVGASARTGHHGFDSRRLLPALLAARNGDFSARLPSDLTGVEGKIADAFNDIMLTNETMARELDRVSRVVGKEGKIGQRASFSSNGRAWRRMEESVNTLVSDLVWPISEITRTIGAVAKGDLTQVMSLEVDGRPLQGEFLRSAKICNTMIGQLGVFTSEVTRVAREVGTEGKLGGQAKVKNVSGVWKELTENVN